jgi:hypothetical protein
VRIIVVVIDFNVAFVSTASGVMMARGFAKPLTVSRVGNNVLLLSKRIKNQLQRGSVLGYYLSKKLKLRLNLLNSNLTYLTQF